MDGINGTINRTYNDDVLKTSNEQKITNEDIIVSDEPEDRYNEKTDFDIFKEKKEFFIESVQEEKKKKREFPQFKKFLFATILYAIAYTLCRYKNGTGIFTSIEYFATISYVTYSFAVFGYKMKVGYLFASIAYLLLGLNICLTADRTIIVFDRIGGILILLSGMLHESFDDSEWGFAKYFTALNEFFWGSVLHVADPIIDANEREKKGKINPNVKYVVIGIAIAIPLTLIVTILLATADMMFGKIFVDFFEKVNVGDGLLMILMALAVFISAYALLRKLSMRDIKEEVKKKKGVNPVIGITFNSVLSFIYLVFSVYQFVFLFFGAGLPEGYTYAEYAHEGFYQLVAVSILNLLIVFISKVVFEKNKVLNVILAITSLCTFVMIASSAYRMILYIDVYRLTVLRVLTLWALAVITLIMAVICLYIFVPKIPATKIMVAIVTVMYIGLAYSHPTKIIANYNMKEFIKTGTGDLRYVASLDEAYEAFLIGDCVISSNLPKEAKDEFVENRRLYYTWEQGYTNYKKSFREYNFELEKIADFEKAYAKVNKIIY